MSVKRFHGCAEKGELQGVEEELKNGVDINEKHGWEGLTALHRTAKSDQMEVMQYLLAKGADIEAKDSAHWTSLHLATKHDNWTIVQYLIEKGANLESTDPVGQTPLRVAMNFDSPQSLQILIDAGAKPQEPYSD